MSDGKASQEFANIEGQGIVRCHKKVQGDQIRKIKIFVNKANNVKENMTIEQIVFLDAYDKFVAKI